VSAFSPATYEEAKATHKPLSRRTPLRAARRASGVLPPLPAPGKLTRGRTLRGNGPSGKKSARKTRETDGKLKKRVWKEFSIHIRTRDADEDGYVPCVTCPAKEHWKDMQAGHFIPGRLNANLFDERGVHAQCRKCNLILGGNGPKYYQFMLEAYGENVISELIVQNEKTKKWQPGELRGLLDKYRELNAENPLVR